MVALLALELGLVYCHLRLFVGIDIHTPVHTHRHGVRDESGGVARFGSGGGDEGRSTVLDTDMHKHEGVHTPIQPRRSGMIGHKQKWGRKTMVDRWYIGIEKVGGNYCRYTVGWKHVCECKLSKGESAGLGGKRLTWLLRTGRDL